MLQNVQIRERLDTSVCKLCISDAASEADLVRASRLPTKLPCLSSFKSGVICVQHNNQDFACKFVMKSELFIVFRECISQKEPQFCLLPCTAAHKYCSGVSHPKVSGNSCVLVKQGRIQYYFLYMHIAVLLKHIACTQSQVEVSKRKSIFMIAMNSSQVILQSQLGVGKGLAETPRAQTNLINKLDGILQQWASLLNG